MRFFENEGYIMPSNISKLLSMIDDNNNNQVSISVYDRYEKERRSWEDIFILADQILVKWEQNSMKKTINPVLNDINSEVNPILSLGKDFHLSFNCKLPLRRINSLINLNEICLKEKQIKNKIKSNYKRSSSIDINELIKFEPFEINLIKRDFLDDINLFITKEKNKNKNNKQEQQLHQELEQQKQQLNKLIYIKEVKKKLLESNSNKRNNLSNICSPKRIARSLINEIRLDNPISLAIQLTNINKELYQHLSPSQVFHVIINRKNHLERQDSIETIIAFNDEVRRMVINVITREQTLEGQSRKIAAFIEVACALRKLRNWNCLEVIINALQSPRIFILSKSWLNVKVNYLIHFSDYHKLSCFVKLFDENLIQRNEYQPSIPSLKLIINTLKFQCMAEYDLHQVKRKWHTQNTLVEWIEREFDEIKLLTSRKKLQIQCNSPKHSHYCNHHTNDKSLISCIHNLSNNNSIRQQRLLMNAVIKGNYNSLLPNDEIRLISFKTLPKVWLENDLRSISSQHLLHIYKRFLIYFHSEIDLIRYYQLKKTYH